MKWLANVLNGDDGLDINNVSLAPSEDKLDHFWEKKLFVPSSLIYNYDGKADAELYEEQANHLASAILIQDYDPAVQVDEYHIVFEDKLKWPNKGEFLSGSFVSRCVTKSIHGYASFEAEDVDIYFHCKEDALEFIRLNGMTGFNMDSPICGYGSHNDIKYNLIWGIEYKNAKHLISRFDIRACAMAICPTDKLLFVVRGAIDDCQQNKITFNPVPRGVSVRRLIKYVEKGFQIDPHQRLFFAELVRSDLYSTELELITANY